LNALDDDGHPIYDGEGKTLLDRVEFYESDLLSYCRYHMIELDCIVGCIPQVCLIATIFWWKEITVHPNGNA
jgi:methionine S-methyltransferase